MTRIAIDEFICRITISNKLFNNLRGDINNKNHSPPINSPIMKQNVEGYWQCLYPLSLFCEIQGIGIVGVACL